MKKLLLLLSAVGMIFTACENGSLDDGSNGGNGNGGGEVYDPNNPLSNQKCSNNELLYISKSCLPMELSNYDGWGAKLISNTYENGVGRLKFDAKVTAIASNAFKYNDILEYIKLPNSVTSIGEDAFYNCTSLTSVTIPDSVTSIGDNAFSGCSSLTDTYVNITDLAAYAKSNNTHRFPGYKHLLVDGKEITELVIPDSVTEIGSSAFRSCTSLTSVTIGNSVTSIGDYAFQSCSSLTSIIIPDSVTSIGRSAFYYCTSLKEVYCKPTTPPTGDFYMFDDNASGRKIYVPRNSEIAYKAATYWKDYASYIEGYDF